MRTFSRSIPRSIFLALLLCPAMAQAQPIIDAITNNYSYIARGMPNYGIAQGSIFVVFGKSLTNAPAGLQSMPLPLILNNVSVKVTVNGVTTQAPIYYVTANMLAAVLPSATPVGAGQLTVTNNGLVSQPFPIQVVESAFGILTLNNGGYGAAAAFDVQSHYVGFTNALNPGEFFTLWGTGLGASTGDETVQQVPKDLTVPITVEVGGISATVQYHGRSIYPGLDQINVVVPPGTSGCFVSVVVRSGSYVSNFATIPVAPTGRVCSDANTGLGTAELSLLAGKPSFTIGRLSLNKSVTVTPAFSAGGITIPGATSTVESALAGFTRFTPTVLSSYSLPAAGGQLTSTGSCSVFSFARALAEMPSPFLGTIDSLNAGPTITVRGPNGTQSIPFRSGTYSSDLPAGFIPAAGGVFSFDNGAGGPDITAFSQQFNVGPALTWLNMDSISSINRSQGVTITWTGGQPNSFVVISGNSVAVNGDQSLAGHFTCTAPVAAGQFTVPSSVLLAMPVSTSIQMGGISIPASTAILAVGNYTTPVSFTLPNVDVATAGAATTVAKVVPFQ